MTHTAIDRRSLMMHRIIAERLRTNPALLEVPLANLARWNCPERAWWPEWAAVLEKPLEEIIAVMLRDDEEGCRMRQNSPFAGILSPQEVWKFKREFKEALLEIAAWTPGSRVSSDAGGPEVHSTVPAADFVSAAARPLSPFGYPASERAASRVPAAPIFNHVYSHQP